MICNVFDFPVNLTHAHCVADQIKINIADLAIFRKHSPEKMPDFCCAYGCSNKRTGNCQLSFYRIPFGTDKESLELRQKWVNAIKREN